MTLTNKASKQIKERFRHGDNTLIVVSKPVDADALGTALSVSWYLEQINKKNKIVLFAQIPSDYKNFPDIHKVVQTYPDKIDFNFYDLIVLVDGNAWKQFFTNDYEKFLSSIKQSNIVNIDHHIRGEIEDSISDLENVLRVEECCTAKVFYDFFLRDEFLLDQIVSEYMFLALVGDTGNFKHAIYKDTFAFAQLLTDTGIDTKKLLYKPQSKEVIDFTFWLYQNTDFYPEIKTMLVKLDKSKKDEAESIFGSGWDFNNLDSFYKLHIGGNIDEFNYFVRFSEENNNSANTRISWRKSNFLAEMDLMKIFKKCGFIVGGHANAGGGIAPFEINSAIDIFLKYMSLENRSGS